MAIKVYLKAALSNYRKTIQEDQQQQLEQHFFLLGIRGNLMTNDHCWYHIKYYWLKVDSFKMCTNFTWSCKSVLLNFIHDSNDKLPEYESCSGHTTNNSVSKCFVMASFYIYTNMQCKWIGATGFHGHVYIP